MAPSKGPSAPHHRRLLWLAVLTVACSSVALCLSHQNVQPANEIIQGGQKKNQDAHRKIQGGNQNLQGEEKYLNEEEPEQFKVLTQRRPSPQEPLELIAIEEEPFSASSSVPPKHSATSTNNIPHHTKQLNGSQGTRLLGTSARMPNLHKRTTTSSLLHATSNSVVKNVLNIGDGASSSFKNHSDSAMYDNKYDVNIKDVISDRKGSYKSNIKNFNENHKDKYREGSDSYDSLINVVHAAHHKGEVLVADPLSLEVQTGDLQYSRRRARSVNTVVSSHDFDPSLVGNKTTASVSRVGLTTVRNLDADGNVVSDFGRNASGVDEFGSYSLDSNDSSRSTHNSLNCSDYPGNEHGDGVHLVTLRWAEVGVYFTITAFVIFAGLGKLAFHQLHWLSSKVPESCLLIVLGLLMGLLIHFTTQDTITENNNQASVPGGISTDETDPELTCHHHVQFPAFTSQAFFLVLLPPIILESAYSLHDRSFIDNIGTVLIFAVIGTLLNTFIIGPSLYGLAAVGAMGDFNITLTESLVFSSLVSAVDPVAVLNIFQDLGVNKALYFLVFGESLLNDGVTVVVYNTLSVFMEMDVVKAKDYVLAVLAFFIVSLCGAFIGLIYGFLTALVTRATTTVRVVEPLALLGFAYLAYLSAELFHFSGIISLIVCGLVQAQYAFKNISTKSYTCVKYFTKMASATSETIIFMFLGMVLVSEDHVWHTGFVLWTLALCFVVRFIITLTLSAITNRYRLHAIGLSEQLILAYGGLRGAVAFSLVTMLPQDMLLRDHFVTATLCVVLFTVFVQGITIRPLVNWLNVSKRMSGPRKLMEEVHFNVIDHMMAGIEEVLGQHGDFYLREQMRFYNDKYLKRWLVRPTSEAPLKRLFEKIAITEHYAHLYGPAVLIQDQHMKLVESPYGSKRPSIACVTTHDNCDHVTLDELRLGDGIPAALLPCHSVQLRGRKNSEDTRVNMQAAGAAPVAGGAGAGATTTPANSVEADAKMLRRAISSNPYNQLHYKYNRNLVNAEHQELSDHLQRRREKAKRLTRLASQSSLRQSSLLASGDGAATSLTAQFCPPSSVTGQPYSSTWQQNNSSYTPGAPATLASTLSGGGTRSPRQRRDTIRMTPEDIAEIQRQEHQRLSGSNHAGHPQSCNSVVLPGEVFSPPHEALTSLPEGMDLMQDIRTVNSIIDCHQRRSAYRRSTLRHRRDRAVSEGLSDTDHDLETNVPLLPPLFQDSDDDDHQQNQGHKIMMHNEQGRHHSQLSTDQLLSPVEQVDNHDNQPRQSTAGSLSAPRRPVYLSSVSTPDSRDTTIEEEL